MKLKNSDKYKTLKKQLKHGTLSVVFTALFIAGVIMLNIIVSLVSARFDTVIDTTPGQIFSIEDETVNFIENITDSITITVCSRESDFLTSSAGTQKYYNQTNEILKRFAGASANIELKYIDLMSNPDFAAKYDSRLNQSSVIIESENTGRHKILTADDYFSISYYDLINGVQISEDDYRAYASLGMADYVRQDVSAAAESAFLSAIMTVSDAEPVYVGILTGHGESNNTAMTALLEKNAYNTVSIDIITEEIAPEIDFIIADSPAADYSVAAISKLADWLDNNGEFGKSLMYIAHHNAETPNIDSFMEEWGIGIERVYVMQSDSRYTAPVAGVDFPIQYYKPVQFGEKLNPEYRIFGEYLRHTKQVYEARQNIETAPILSAYNGAVLVTFEDAEQGGTMPEKKGEYPVGIISSKLRFEELDVFKSNIIAFGGSFIFNQGFLEMRNANNAEYFIAMMNEVNGKETVVTIAPKSFAVSSFEISANYADIIGLVFAVILPVAVVVTGVVIWLRRRKR